MEFMSLSVLSLLGAAAGYGVLVLASRSRGFLRALGIALGTLVAAGSLLAAAAGVMKCPAFYPRKCPMSEVWQRSPVPADQSSNLKSVSPAKP